MAADAERGTGAVDVEAVLQLERTPTELEKAANQEALAAIRQALGSRAQTIINLLLSFDGYFAWYYPYKKSIPLYSSLEVREERALDNMRRAIDMHEIFERVSIRAHCSFLPHGSIYKTTRDILHVSDVHPFRLSKLELHNAEAKRIVSKGASRTLELRQEGKSVKPLLKREGPSQLVETKGYGTTLALSCLTKLLAQSALRQGSGPAELTIPDSRIRERVFGANGSGRSKSNARGTALIGLESEYDPSKDTCIECFARDIAALAAEVA